jgi:hypothetical protein
MTKFNNNHGRRSESGFALFIAIFTLLLITAIAVGMLMLTNTDTNISTNFRDEQTAFFAAKAGLEEVRDRMRINALDPTAGTSVSLNFGLATPPGGVQVLPGAVNLTTSPPLPGQSGGVTYILNPLNGETVAPWNIDTATTYPDTEICFEMINVNYGSAACGANPTRPLPSNTWYNSTSASSAYASNPVQAWKWVRINVKTNYTSSGTGASSTVDGVTTDHNQLVCWNGNTQITVASGSSCASAGAVLIPAQNYTPVYVLTALAVTPSGSRRMLQMDVATSIIPNIPGAMVMDGALASFTPGTSAAFQACGMDGISCDGSTTHPPQNGTVCPPHGNEPAVGTYDNASAANANAAILGVGRTGSYTGSPTSVANVGTALGAGGMNTVQGLTALVNEVAAAANPANTYTTTSALANPGTVINPVINVVTGDLDITNLTGAGILLVEGNASFSGRPNYDGVILIVGKGHLSMSGGGNGVIDGAMLVANLYDSTGNRLTSGAPGIPVMDFSGNGNMTIQYDSCWVAAMNQSSPYSSLGVREMTY